MTPREVAERFVALQDSGDLAGVRELLDETCTYDIGEARHLYGPDEILASYAANAEFADAWYTMVYSSRVVSVDGRDVTVEFVDEAERNGHCHTHRCHQVLTVGERGLIHHIRHVPLPGEAEKLDHYFESVLPNAALAERRGS